MKMAWQKIGLSNYPKIQIDRANIIKPCVSDQVAADQFVSSSQSGWSRILSDFWHEGFPIILRHLSNLKPEGSKTYYSYLIKAVKYIAMLMIHVHQVYLYIYGYFYPYSLLSADSLCDEFSRCMKWSESVIRAFAWHPTHDRCAVAIFNDYIYVYQGPNRIKVLRHNHQRKIVDMAWQPTNKDVLLVATQTNIIVWRISDSSDKSHFIRDPLRTQNFAYLAPGLSPTIRDRDKSLNGSIDSLQNRLTATSANSKSLNNPYILFSVLKLPIVSLTFDKSGDKLIVSSPNSSKIAIIDIQKILSLPADKGWENSKNQEFITYITNYGQGITRLVMSPDMNRLATVTTSSYFKVFETFNWSCKYWESHGGPVQDIVWSRPAGRMLFMANKTEPILYALPFLDEPLANDVGGNKSMMRALDLSPTETESCDTVGGLVHSLVWDKGGRRLAISFKDNPETILLYKTVEKPSVEFQQIGSIKSENGCFPSLMQFHDKFENGSLLTICWSDGQCQHVKLSHKQTDTPQTQSPRLMTSFCKVNGNNRIGSLSKPGIKFEPDNYT